MPGAIPLRSAAASTIGLKDDPGCRSACVARLNWLRWKFVPPNIAFTAPVRGSIATSAAAGPFGSCRIFSIATPCLVLEVEVDGRRHLEAAAEHLLGAVPRDELVGDVVDEVRSRPARPGEADVLGLRERRRVRAPHLARGDAPLVVELLQDVPAPLLRRHGVLHRVVQRRARGDPGEERRLGERQLGRALAVEVGARRLEDPVGPVPEVDRVEVGGRGSGPSTTAASSCHASAASRTLRAIVLSLRLYAFLTYCCVIVEPPSTTALLRMSSQAARSDPADVDAVVLEEPLVLDRDDRLLHDRRDLVRPGRGRGSRRHAGSRGRAAGRSCSARRRSPCRRRRASSQGRAPRARCGWPSRARS